MTKEYDHYAKQLRLVDAAVQQCNWTTEVDSVEDCFKDYADVPKVAAVLKQVVKDN